MLDDYEGEAQGENMIDDFYTTPGMLQIFFDLNSEWEEEKDWSHKEAVLRQQREIVYDIFSSQARDHSDLNRKAEILLYLLENPDNHYYPRTDMEIFAVNILHDVLNLVKHEKLSPPSAYPLEAVANHYNWMFSGWRR